MNESRLLAFAEIWSSNRVDQIMSFFTDDCVYNSSVGQNPGEIYHGKKNVENGIVKMITKDQSVESSVSNIHIFGRFGFWEWKYILTNDEVVLGCDYFEFDGDLIKYKNAFRKVRAD